MDSAILLANNFLNLLNEFSIYILVGLLIAGILKQIVPDDFIIKHLGKGDVKSVVKATVFGIPLPICSCSVIPLAQSLRKEGASKGAVQSFLISTPITGVDSILATFSFFGLVFTIYRVVSSIIIAIGVGIFQNIFEKEEVKTENRLQPSFNATATFTPKINTLNTKTSSFQMNPNLNEKKEENSSSCCSSGSCCDSNNTNTKKSFSFTGALKYAYVTLFKDMVKPLLVGLILGAVFTTFAPREYTSILFENQILTYFVVMLFAMPLYVCATASLPIAAALVMQGMSGGAAFIFLTAGPATSAITMSIVYKTLGKKSLFIYLISIFVLTFIFALGFDLFFGNIDLMQFMTHSEESSLISNIASLIMLAMMIFYLLPKKSKNI